MEKPMSNAVMIGVILMALAAVIGLAWGVFSLSKTTVVDGTSEVQEKIMKFEDLNWDSYDDKEVLGREILALHTTSTYDNIAILVHTVRMKDGVPVSKDNDRYVQYFDGEPYVNYAAILGVEGKEYPNEMLEFIVKQGEKLNKKENTLNHKDGAIYTNTIVCRDELDNVVRDDSITALKRDNTVEYINEKTIFDSKLIYDVSGEVAGVLFRQQEFN